ncbi:MAG: hypothetical protein A2293_01720 [Elusimicrobia bacterium RIFOXYB2_FULL_49_7]|nr:MAG: hypothetical protein A2293_01720 [Elusimicrobia bacterium RIFOXYB2_FULL_49_7]
MTRRNPLLIALLIFITLCLVKLAFFSPSNVSLDMVPAAHADGGILEWNNSLRIVTSSADGATTYVWDYQGKTMVRKYSLEGNKLKLQVFEIE